METKPSKEIKDIEEMILILTKKIKKWKLAFGITSGLFFLIILGMNYISFTFFIKHIMNIFIISVIIAVFFAIPAGIIRIKLKLLLDKKKEKDLENFFYLSREEQINFLKKNLKS